MPLKKLSKNLYKAFDINKTYKDERVHLRGTSKICYFPSVFELI